VEKALNKARYRCLYCGSDDVCNELSPKALRDKRCSVCNHNKFTIKKIATYNVFGYDEDNKDRKEDDYFPFWSD